MNHRGSAILESLAVTVLIFALALGIGQVARAATAKIWLDHCLYEALICVAEERNQSQCEADALAGARKLPLGSRKLHLKLTKRNGQWQGELNWEGAWGLNAKTRQQLALR